MGVTARPTRDFDILAPVLPPEIAEAARAFARTRPVFEGRALALSTLGRADLLKTKLFALCDRGTDLSDCVALAPTVVELDEAVPWLAEQDATPEWPAHVDATIADLNRRLGHGI